MRWFPGGPALVWGSERASLGQRGSAEFCGRAERFLRGGNSAAEGPVVGRDVSLEPRGGHMLGGGSCLLVAVVGPADLVRGWLWWRGRRKSQIASLNSNSYYGCVCVRVTRGRGQGGVFY